MDEIDQMLIKEFQKNGRKSYTKLARKLRVVEGTVRRRTKRLLAQETMKIVAIPNVQALGYSMIAIMGIQVRMEELRAVADNLARSHYVGYLAFVTGRYDLMAVVMARSPQELSKLVEREISIIPGVLRTETFINLDIIKGNWGFLDTTELLSDIGIPLQKRT